MKKLFRLRHSSLFDGKPSRSLMIKSFFSLKIILQRDCNNLGPAQVKSEFDKIEEGNKDVQSQKTETNKLAKNWYFTFYYGKSRLKFAVAMYIENTSFSLSILICAIIIRNRNLSISYDYVCAKCEVPFTNIVKNYQRHQKHKYLSPTYFRQAFINRSPFLVKVFRLFLCYCDKITNPLLFPQNFSRM